MIVSIRNGVWYKLGYIYTYLYIYIVKLVAWNMRITTKADPEKSRGSEIS